MYFKDYLDEARVLISSAEGTNKIDVLTALESLNYTPQMVVGVFSSKTRHGYKYKVTYSKVNHNYSLDIFAHEGNMSFLVNGR